MKKLISSIAVFALVCFTTMAFAADNPKPSEQKTTTSHSTNTIIGKVVSVDKAANVIVVKDQETNTDKTFTLKAKDIAPIKKGNIVKIVLAPGTTNEVGYIYVTTPEKLKKLNQK